MRWFITVLLLFTFSSWAHSQTPVNQILNSRIYLYPKTSDSVEVKLNVVGGSHWTNLNNDQPYRVLAHPDGKLETDSGTFRYLMWEGEHFLDSLDFDLEAGFLVYTDSLEAFFESTLEQLNFNPQEKLDFIAHWTPQMMECKPCYIHFLINDEFNQYARLKVSPNPDRTIRLFMVAGYVSKLEQHKIKPQKLPNYNRKGFTVVEWGGGFFETTETYYEEAPIPVNSAKHKYNFRSSIVPAVSWNLGAEYFITERISIMSEYGTYAATIPGIFKPKTLQSGWFWDSQLRYGFTEHKNTWFVGLDYKLSQRNENENIEFLPESGITYSKVTDFSSNITETYGMIGNKMYALNYRVFLEWKLGLGLIAIDQTFDGLEDQDLELIESKNIDTDMRYIGHGQFTRFWPTAAIRFGVALGKDKD